MQVQDFNFLWTLLEKDFNKPNIDQDWATIEQISQAINLVNWSVSEVLQITFELVLKYKKKKYFDLIKRNLPEKINLT